MAESIFAGVTVDAAPIIKGLKDAMVIGIPVMITITGIQRGVGFLKGTIKGK